MARIPTEIGSVIEPVAMDWEPVLSGFVAEQQGPGVRRQWACRRHRHCVPQSQAQHRTRCPKGRISTRAPARNPQDNCTASPSSDHFQSRPLPPSSCPHQNPSEPAGRWPLQVNEPQRVSPSMSPHDRRVEPADCLPKTRSSCSRLKRRGIMSHPSIWRDSHQPSAGGHLTWHQVVPQHSQSIDLLVLTRGLRGVEALSPGVACPNLRPFTAQ